MKRIEDRSATINIPFGTEVTIISYQVPHGAGLDITHFGNFVRDPAALEVLTWKLKRNGVVLYPFEAVTTMNGEEGQPRPVGSGDLHFYGGDKLEITATNASADTDFDAGAAFRGELK